MCIVAVYAAGTIHTLEKASETPADDASPEVEGHLIRKNDIEQAVRGRDRSIVLRYRLDGPSVCWLRMRS